jgi:hypothetical protein
MLYLDKETKEYKLFYKKREDNINALSFLNKLNDTNDCIFLTGKA